MRYGFPRLAAVLCALTLASSAYAKPDEYDFIDESSATQAAIAAQGSFMELGEMPLQTRVRTFYEENGFRPVWSGGEDASERLDSLHRTLSEADAQGLRPAKYLSSLNFARVPEPGQDAALFDIALTTALFRYALDVRIGQFKPKDVYADASLPAQQFDVEHMLHRALQSGSFDSFLFDLPPRHDAYRQLVQQLARYRAIATRGGWPAVTGKKPVTLRERLALEDDQLAGIARPSAKQLREALVRYQKRNNLDASGKLDAVTLKTLNVPASFRVQQIAANMERWRWMPRALASRYIMVNAADQMAAYVEDGQDKLHSRVVIGKKDTPTPIVSANVDAVVANPPWDIPKDISANELLPHLKKDAKYLADREMVLTNGPEDDPYGTTVDWSVVEPADFNYDVQQKPGPNNVLGRVMLDAPNEFGVYMHGTPNKKLFLLDVRERSHGCVRVEEIMPLARLALAGESDGDSELSDALEGTETTRLPLSEPLEVYMVYWTTIPNADGTLRFAPDRYDRDAILIAKLPDESMATDAMKRGVISAGM